MLPVRIKHFRKNNGQLYATIGTVMHPDGMVSVAVARVHKKDSPNKKMGVSIVTARLEAYLSGKDVKSCFKIPHVELVQRIKNGTLISPM